jgi:hypothetical protein
MSARQFIKEEDGGVSTIDWLVLLGALTGAGIALVDVTGNTLRDHSGNIRGELQDPYFETAWAQNLPVGPSGAGMPGITPVGNVSTPGGGDDGQGGEPDGNDTSNPGDSNDPNDGSDSGGTPGTTDPAPTDPEPEPQPEPEPEPEPQPEPEPDPTDPGGAGGGVQDPAPQGPVVPASNVAGCPAPDLYIAQPVARTGEALEENRIRLRNMTVGGASTHLSSCPGIPGLGFFHANPTYTLDLSDMEDFWRLEIQLSSDCDTTLLVQDAAGNFHFDDDSGPGLNGRVRLFNMANLEGRVNIWVGTYWNQTCSNTELRIRLDD